MSQTIQIATCFTELMRMELGYVFDSLCIATAHEKDPSICHSHDHCDANMVMDAAFDTVLGRNSYLTSSVEEGGCTEEEQTADTVLWNASWDMAKQMWIGLGKLLVPNEIP